MNPYDIEQAFANIERDIIRQMIDRFRKDRPEGDVGNYEWKDWQVRQLKSVDKFIRSISKQYRGIYRNLNKWIRRMTGDAFDGGISESIREQMENTPDDEQFFDVNRTRMEALQKATTDDLERAEGAVFRRVNDAYRQIIYRAQVALNSGQVTYEQAVDMATKDFLRSGINCVEYRNGARHTVQEYARMVLRTTMKRSALMAEGQIRTELGIHTVYARWRSTACPECMRFLGRIMIDDVYSDGTVEEAEEGGYLLLSEAMEQGFLHPNCKDTIATYDPERWKDDPDNDPFLMSQKRRDEYMAIAEENERREQEASYLLNRAEMWERYADFSLSESVKKEAESKAKKYNEKWLKSLPRTDKADNTWKDGGGLFVEAFSFSDKPVDLSELLEAARKTAPPHIFDLLYYAPAEGKSNRWLDEDGEGARIFLNLNADKNGCEPLLSGGSNISLKADTEIRRKFHELAHALDRLYSTDTTAPAYSSEGFGDLVDYIANQKSPDSNKERANEADNIIAFLKEIDDESSRDAIMDIYDALWRGEIVSDEDISFRFKMRLGRAAGHGRKYYRSKQNRIAEIFAQYIAIACSDRYAFERFCQREPELSAILDDMIETIVYFEPNSEDEDEQD